MQNVDAVDVSGTGLDLVDLDDGSLLAMARTGHREAYAALFSRYSYAAHRLARHLGQREDSDDVVSEAFAQVLDLLGRGKGPDTAFRAYLFTTVRHECARRAKARKRVMPTDDLGQIDSPVAFGNGELDDFERSAIRAAYESLPARWRTVLWHLDVEGRKPHELGPLLDLSANSVSALVYRARAGLREAYLQQHVKQQHPDDSRTCAEHRVKLSAFVRRTSSAREQERMHAHLESCRECMAIYLDLQEVNRDVGLVTGSTAVLGALGLSVASLGAQATVLVKGLAAVLVPPAAAAAIASAALIGVPTSSVTEPTRVAMTAATAGSSTADVPADLPSASVVRVPRREVAPAGAGSSRIRVVAAAPVEHVRAPAAAARPTASVPAPVATNEPAPIVTSPRAASAPAPTPAPVLPVPVRIDLPASPADHTTPRLAASLGSVDLAVGGPDGLVSLTVAQ
jgi:RNA polymerase sigma factor (sigma-70 family)